VSEGKDSMFSCLLPKQKCTTLRRFVMRYCIMGKTHAKNPKESPSNGSFNWKGQIVYCFVSKVTFNVWKWLNLIIKRIKLVW